MPGSRLFELTGGMWVTISFYDEIAFPLSKIDINVQEVSNDTYIRLHRKIQEL